MKYTKAFYWTAVNNEVGVTVKFCSLAPMLREMGLFDKYAKIYSNMRLSKTNSTIFSKYTFTRVTENPYPRIMMLLNGEIRIEQRATMFSGKKEYVEAPINEVVVKRKVGRPRKNFNSDAPPLVVKRPVGRPRKNVGIGGMIS